MDYTVRKMIPAEFKHIYKSIKHDFAEGEYAPYDVYYGLQCPYIPNCIEQIKTYCDANEVKINLVKIDTLEKAKDVPCVFNNWAVFYKGEFKTVHLLNEGYLKKLLGKCE